MVLFSVRLWRAMMVTLALRDVPTGAASPASPGKRRTGGERRHVAASAEARCALGAPSS